VAEASWHPTPQLDWVKRASTLRLEIVNLVNGNERAPSGAKLLEKFNPRDGKLLYQFQTSMHEDVDSAVAAARDAFSDGRWWRQSVQCRAEALLRLAALIEQHREEFALLESLDTGKPIRDAFQFDVPRAIATLKFCAAAADKTPGQVYGADLTSLSFQSRRALGVVGGIIGWNFPLVLAAEKIGPALAMGNSIVLKPSELTSLSAVMLGRLAMQSGIPEGVLNILHGGSTVGDALARHRDVDMITFTGSSQTGRRLLVAAGNTNMKRLLLECGGKAPNIVFDDAPDLRAVASGVVARAFWNQGQVCTASSRLLVHKSVKEELMGLVLECTSVFFPGDPLRVDTSFGALVSAGHREKVLGYIETAKADGATLLTSEDSRGPLPGGYYVEPAIFDEVSRDRRIAQEEIFGPVLAVLTFADDDDAVSIANGTIYGLSAILWTTDLSRAHRISQAINAGWVVVNGTATPRGGPGAGILSIGGHQQSGFGLEGGLDGLRAYTRETAIQFFT